MLNGFKAYRRHVNPALAQLLEMTGMNIRFVRASGCLLHDDQGREYLDFFSGSGTFNLGHNPAPITEAVAAALREQPLQIYGTAINPFAGELAERLTTQAGDPFEIAFFTNSGSEAVEGALKLARAATGRSQLVYCQNAYHGTTMGSLSCMESGIFRDPFEPLLPGCHKIPFNDPEALEHTLAARECAAFILEPVQAEGGVILPAPGYLTKAAELCRHAGTILILDEIQTGLGRTGPFFAFQDESAIPGIVTVAKALGGGILPAGAYLTSREIHRQAYGSFARCESHHTTFGGNTLACRAALAALDRLGDPQLHRQVREAGDYFLAALQNRLGNSPLVRSIRGRGLLAGVEFAPSGHPQLQWQELGIPDLTGRDMTSQLIMKRMLDHGVLTQPCAHAWQVLKLEPPLIVHRTQLDRCVEVLEEAVRWLESII